ncbi:hypothetical protein ACFVH6_29580 [Spirillospora sp. NPDC127200]
MPVAGVGEVHSAKLFEILKVAPDGARPVMTECVSRSAAFRSATRNAPRAPLPAYAPAPRYSPGSDSNAGWNVSRPNSNV